jgi:hypothetical protein
VMAAKPVFADRAQLAAWLDRLAAALAADDRAAADRVFGEAIPDFLSRSEAAGETARLSRAG